MRQSRLLALAGSQVTSLDDLALRLLFSLEERINLLCAGVLDLAGISALVSHIASSFPSYFGFFRVPASGLVTLTERKKKGAPPKFG